MERDGRKWCGMQWSEDEDKWGVEVEGDRKGGKRSGGGGDGGRWRNGGKNVEKWIWSGVKSGEMERGRKEVEEEGSGRRDDGNRWREVDMEEGEE